MGIVESLVEPKCELSDFRRRKLLHEFRVFYGECLIVRGRHFTLMLKTG